MKVVIQRVKSSSVQINQKIKSEINNLKQEIAAKESETNSLYETYISEAEGRKGTKIVGKGPVYKEKREKHDASLAALSQLRKNNNLKIAEKEKTISDLKQKQLTAETNSQPIISNFDGLMARVNALQKLLWFPSFFIFLLFFKPA